MSIPNEPPAGNLQFDQAEFGENSPDRPMCAGCKTPITGQYYEASGQLICPACRERFESAMSGGSGLKRGLKALVLGLIAAAIGSAAYYAIMRATGLNIGLVAIVLGILIGGAVKMGSDSRGGWFYQLLALFLTYTAIAAMHIPDIIASFAELRDQAAIEANGAAPNEAAPPILAEAGAPANAALVQQQGEPEPPPTAEELLFGIGALSVFAYALPIFITIESPISGLIYAFALWEAWKLNKKPRVVFNGPYSLAPQDSDKPEGSADGV